MNFPNELLDLYFFSIECANLHIKVVKLLPLY